MSLLPLSLASAPSLAALTPVRNLPDILLPTKESDIQLATKDSSTIQGAGGVGDAERHCISLNCDVKVLLVICCGIFQPDQSPLLDKNAKPWCSVKAPVEY